MAKTTPDQAAAQWATRLGQSTQKIQQGIESVTVAPGQAAARQADVWVQNTAAAKDKWRANVANVSLQDWQQAVISKGLARVGPGATAAQAKFATFMGQLLPHIDRVKSSLPPRGTFEQNLNRMTQFATGMHQFKRNG